MAYCPPGSCIGKFFHGRINSVKGSYDLSKGETVTSSSQFSLNFIPKWSTETFPLLQSLHRIPVILLSTPRHNKIRAFPELFQLSRDLKSMIVSVLNGVPVFLRNISKDPFSVITVFKREKKMSDEDSSKGSPSKKRKLNESFRRYQNSYVLTCKWRGMVDAKLHGASPYYFFLTKIEDSPKTHEEDLTITFPELLDKSLGPLEDSLHINFLVELPWLLAQYAVNDIFNPAMTILYDAEDDDLTNVPPHLKLTAVRVKSPYAFGHHHTKMSIFYYKDKSLRFVVYTANLVESDWENRTQGVWISPKCPYLGDDVPINYGESETLFKVDVLRYLNSYRLPQLKEWLHRIQKSDCSSIRVCFVGSVPGEHKDSSFGHKKLNKLLKEHASGNETEKWELVAQCSSIGSLGSTPDSWLCGEFAQSLQGTARASVHPINVIYPSVKNVEQSHDGMLGGACLPYSSQTHKKQLWLQEYLRQWKSDHRHRSKAVPHIKTYTKMSVRENKISWLLLTSANLSKAAWGKFVKGGVLKIMSYEAGVLFLPKFLNDQSSFQIKKGGNSEPEDKEFPLPFDSPLTSYHSTDKIFLYDKCFPR